MPSKKWLLSGALALVFLVVVSAMRTDSVWEGVDVAVVGKAATDLGREPWTPLINVQGDLQLFVFTVAGLIGGFAMGYYWRLLFGDGAAGKRRPSDSPGGGTDVPGV